MEGKKQFTGALNVKNGVLDMSNNNVAIFGKSLLHSAPLSAVAFQRSFFGIWGKYIISISLLLFAFSTAISWSYYGERSMTYLFGTKSIFIYRIIYVIAFFFASFTDTTIIWNLSAITITLMAIPNLIGILILSKEMKTTVKEYWTQFNLENPDKKTRFID
jgi:AGCS family alanine or glycine:cation symporter